MLTHRVSTSNEHLYLKSGISFHHSVEEFNYIRTWDTLAWKNDIPNSTLINVQSTRTVKHDNKYSYLSIPLMIGAQQQKNQFQYGLGVGLGFNFSQSQTGRILNSGSYVTDFPNTETNLLPRKAFYISYLFQPFVSYRLNRKFDLQLRSDFRISSFGTVPFFDLKYTSITSGLEIGFTYRL